MPYALLADAVAVLHLAFVLFVAVGGVAALRWRRLIWWHLPAAAWGTWVELAGWVCPLTPLEVRLRVLAGQQGYEGGFVERYLLPILYPVALTRPLQVAVGLGVLLLNAAIYLILWRRARRRA